MQSLPRLAQLQVLTWLRKKESVDDIKNAVKIIKKDSGFKHGSSVNPKDVLFSFAERTKANYNPDEHPEFFTFEQELSDGSKIYDIKDSEGAAKHLSSIVKALRGHSPWCIVKTANDGTCDGRGDWIKYSAIKKKDGSTARKVLFDKNGLITSLNASETLDPTWWDMEGLPVGYEKIVSSTMTPIGREIRTYDLNTQEMIGPVKEIVEAGDPNRGLYIIEDDKNMAKRSRYSFPFTLEDPNRTHKRLSVEDAVVFDSKLNDFIKERSLTSTYLKRVVERLLNQTPGSIYARDNSADITFRTKDNKKIKVTLNDNKSNIEVKLKSGKFVIDNDPEFGLYESYLKKDNLVTYYPDDLLLTIENKNGSYYLDNNEFSKGEGLNSLISERLFMSECGVDIKSFLAARDKTKKEILNAKFENYGRKIFGNDFKLWLINLADSFKQGALLIILAILKNNSILNIVINFKKRA